MITVFGGNPNMVVVLRFFCLYMDKNWNNLKNECCIFCNKKLQFRLKTSNTHIRARGYQNNLRDDMYFCFRCDFQISRNKLAEVLKNIN